VDLLTIFNFIMSISVEIGQFEENCYVDTYNGAPVSGQISTRQEYLEVLENTSDFCGRWREFSSRKEAQEYIDNYNRR
jgi:hypothetical protein